MHRVGDVGGSASRGQVGVAPQHHRPACGQHARRLEALLGENRESDGVQRDLRKRRGVVFAPARIEVHLGHQLLHRARTVAGDPGRMAQRCGHDTVAHHQQPVVVPGGEPLHHDAASLFAGGVPRGHHLLTCGEVHSDAATLIAVLRLDDDRQPQIFGHLPRLFRTRRRTPLGGRYAHRTQQHLRELLVLRDALADGAGAVGLGGENATGAGAPAELHQAAIVQSPGRNAAVGGRPDDGARGRSQPDVLVLPTQLGGSGRHVKGGAVVRGLEQLSRQLHRTASHLFLAVLHHGLV